ncbi:MAG: M81 family metallopeptidase [Bacillota bacterium]
MRRRRLIIGQISHETNCFSPIRTGIEHFRARGHHSGEKIIEAYAGTRTPLGGFIDSAGEHSAELIPTVAASAVPSGRVEAGAYRQLLDELLEGIHRAGAIDGVLLALHGAMVVEGIPDAEGDILTRVREIIGWEVPLVSTLDYHANVTDTMVRAADGLFGYNTYPHIDGWERGVEGAEFLFRVLEGGIEPVSAVVRPPLAPAVVPARTGWGPIEKLMERAFAWEEEPGVINASVYGGFVYSDIEDAGLSFLATTDGDPGLARRVASDLAEAAWEMRRDFVARMLPPREAVERAIVATSGPVVLADVADNTGGGAAGDGTEVLRALMEAEAREAVVVTMPDPEAVREAFRVGVGGGFSLPVGGKIDGCSGEPVRLRGRVRLLSDGQFVHRGPMSTGVISSMGRTAVVVAGGVEVILNEQRLQPVDPEVPRSVGIDPINRKIIVLKSAVHYRAAYEPIAAEILEVDGPGLSSPNLDRFNFTGIRRPVFPLDDM